MGFPFEFNPAKAASNRRKHGVSFAETITAALDVDSVDADPLLPRKLDLSRAVLGKYYRRMQEGTNIVLLAPDLMEAFPTSEAVNDALRKFQAMTSAKHA